MKNLTKSLKYYVYYLPNYGLNFASNLTFVPLGGNIYY